MGCNEARSKNNRSVLAWTDLSVCGAVEWVTSEIFTTVVLRFWLTGFLSERPSFLNRRPNILPLTRRVHSVNSAQNCSSWRSRRNAKHANMRQEIDQSVCRGGGGGGGSAEIIVSLIIDGDNRQLLTQPQILTYTLTCRHRFTFPLGAETGGVTTGD